MIGRRTFLRAAGLGAAAAALPGCSQHAALPQPTPTPTPSTSPTPSPTSTATPGPRTLAQLRARLDGRLVSPADSGYATDRLAYSPRFDGQRPTAIARCTRPSDVQACVEYAAATRTRLAARSGGHSYAGYSTPNGGLVVDVGPMSSVDVRRDGTALVGAGARLMDVYEGLAAAGRCLPGGSCPTVGIAGLTLGGGIGVLARKFGLTCDRLVSASIVTADGVARTAAPDSEADLYWALRGGGGGNFGIVTSLTFATAPAPALTVFALEFPVGAFTDVLGAWQHWIGGAPPELWSNCTIDDGSPSTCHVEGCFVGGTSGLNPLLDQLVRGLSPLSRSVTAKSYLDAMRHFAGCEQLSNSQCRPAWTGGGGQLQRDSFVASSRIVTAAMGNPQRVVDALTASGVGAIFDSLGGAVAKLTPTDTAFPHRTALASVQIFRSTSASALSAVAAVRDELGTLLGPHGYVNYIDPAMPHWPAAYYGGNVARLQSVARRYDPNAVFAFAQGLAG